MLELAARKDFRTEFEKAVATLPPEDLAALSRQQEVDPNLDPRLDPPAQTPMAGLFRDSERRAALQRLAQNGITHVVFGHTHALVDGDLDGAFFNHGTWLPFLDLKAAYVKAKIAKDGLTLEMLKDDKLYATDRRAVQIVPDQRNMAKVKLISC
jgi:hypothetical protein